jgi:hypothetical protein
MMVFATVPHCVRCNRPFVIRHSVGATCRIFPGREALAGAARGAGGRTALGGFLPSQGALGNGRSRRTADIADRGLGRLSWADSAPTGAAQGTTGERAKAAIL